jgi:hypothetical protein
MDGLITTIVAGVVVTVIGAIVAFYFGGVREREKQLYENQREQQKQLVEREEELKKHRTEALHELQARGSVIVQDVRRTAENAVSLHETLERFPPNWSKWRFSRLSGQDPAQLVSETMQKYAEIMRQRESISAAMDSLRHYYQTQAPYLSAKERNLFEAFDHDLQRRYTPLFASLPDYQSVRKDLYLAEDVKGVDKVRYLLFEEPEGDWSNVRVMLRLREQISGLPEAAGDALESNFQEHRTAIAKEIEALEGIGSSES